MNTKLTIVFRVEYPEHIINPKLKYEIPTIERDYGHIPQIGSSIELFNDHYVDVGHISYRLKENHEILVKINYYMYDTLNNLVKKEISKNNGLFGGFK